MIGRRVVALGALFAIVGASLVIPVMVLMRRGESVPPLPLFPVETMEPQVQTQFAEARLRVEAAPGDAEAVGALGMLFHAYGFHVLAESCYTRALVLAPADRRWRGYQARVALARGRFAEASRAFGRLLDTDPDDVTVLILKAEADRQAHRLDDALAGFERAIEIDTHLPQAHCGAGRVLFELGRLDDAILHLTIATLKAGSYGQARYALGQALRERGHREGAMTQLALAEEQGDVEPELDDPLMAEVALLRRGAIDALHEGIDLLRDRRLAEALPRLEEAVRIAPDLAEAQSQLGAALLLADLDDRARVHLLRAVEIDPDFVDALYNLGLLAHRQGDLEGAVSHFATVVTVRGEHFDAHLGLGTDLPTLGRPDEAIAHLERAGLLRPTDARPYKRLAALLGTAGRHGEAHDVLRRGHAELPEDDSVADRLAWMLATCPDAQLRAAGEALSLAEGVAQRTERRVPMVLATLAAALAGSGRFEDALAVLDEAQRLPRERIGDDLASRLAQQRAAYLQKVLFVE